MYELSDLIVLFCSGFVFGMKYGDRFEYNVLLAVIMAVGVTALTIYSIVKLCKEVEDKYK